MNTPRMRSQSIRSTLQLLHFILTTQLTFLKYFYCYYSLCNSKIFTTRTRARDTQKGRRPRTADDPQEGPEALDDKEPTRVGECLQLIPPFLGSPGGKQPEPLPTVKTCKLVVSCKICLHLFDQYLPDSLSNLISHCLPYTYIKKIFKLYDTSGSSIRAAGSLRAALASTVHCSSSDRSSYVSKFINEDESSLGDDGGGGTGGPPTRGECCKAGDECGDTGEG